MTSLLAVLVNGGILSAPVTIAVWLALRVTPRRALNAATRYAVWWAALAIAMALPELYLPREVAGRVPSHEADPTVASPPANPRGADSRPAQFSAGSSSAGREPAPRWPLFPVEVAGGRLPRWIVAGWIVTTVLMLVRLSLSCVLLERRKARAIDAPAPLAAHVDEWLSRCGSARKARTSRGLD